MIQNKTFIFHWLNDTSATIDGLNQHVPDGWAHIMRKEYLQFFRNAISKNVEDPCRSNYLVGFNDKLCDALLDNDLTDILETAAFDIHLCHSTEDDLVPYNNLPDISRNPNYLSLRNMVGNHLQAANSCWKIELFENGVMDGDHRPTKARCSKEMHQTDLIISNFYFGSGRDAHFKKSKHSIAWTGQMHFKESSDVSEIAFTPILRDFSLQTYELELTMPLLHHSE
jgi:hypothetical protein